MASLADLGEVALIRSVLETYSRLQKCYVEWAADFSAHKDVMQYLRRELGRVSEIHEQPIFDLHSSHWNRFTIPIIKKIAPRDITVLEQCFNRLLRTSDYRHLRRLWYLLFFVHPVRHELYYFDEHYPVSYSARLAKLLRFHRMGLKAANSYLKKKGTANPADPFIRACGTTIFKHLLLHPTTSQYTLLEEDPSNQLRDLAISDSAVSEAEKTTAILLSNQACPKFSQWLSYAPCAINEGPIFTARQDIDLYEAFDSIVKLLLANDITQERVRQCLHVFFDVTELKSHR